MRKLTRSVLVLALLALPMNLVTTGCSDDAGGNEENIVKTTKGTVAPDAPQTPEEYYKKTRGGK